MTPAQSRVVKELFQSLFAPPPSGSVSTWCEGNLIFNEPNCVGPFSMAAREYLREPLDAWGDDEITDMVLVFGSRCGKTRTLMGGVSWTMEKYPSRFIWVMPNTDGLGGVKNFSTTRWKPCLLASPPFKAHIPQHKTPSFKMLSQCLKGSILDFAGSNSPANLSSVPARVVILDEVDKFSEGTRKEADALNLAEQRTKEFSNPKRVKTSTPTLYEAIIWQELLKTDVRRRYLPCPFCGQHVIFAWSREYTVLPKTGAEAYVRWDGEAKNPANGEWDLDKVRSTAHAECPHCKGKILDQHKTSMDRSGEWRPTKTAEHGRIGFHLPAMYSAAKQNSFGALAVRFLQAKSSLMGLQGFINGDLAEPYMAQDAQAKRVELIRDAQKLETADDWVKLLTVDCQAKQPFFWYVVRSWREKKSEALAAGSCDSVEDLRVIQKQWKIGDQQVMLDSGYGSKSEAEIYKMCARFGTLQDGMTLPYHLGWMPAKGMPSRRRWPDPESGLQVPWYLGKIDPYIGTASAGQVEMSLFEFSSEAFMDILDAMRHGREGWEWVVAQNVATEEYWRHMDGEIKKVDRSQKTGITSAKWLPRSKYWPNHLLDCEKMQSAFAAFLQLFELPEV